MVIVPGFTFCATAEAVSVFGGVPIFTDVLEETVNLGPPSLKAAVLILCQSGPSSRGVIALGPIRLRSIDSGWYYPATLNPPPSRGYRISKGIS